jgi:hypothetical protein
VQLLLLKLTLTPCLIGLAGLAQRRWGPAVGGWLVGLPLTSAPVTFLLTLQYGPVFAADAARGTLLGLISGGMFCLGYARVSARHGPLASVVSSCVAFAASTLALSQVRVPVLVAAVLVVTSLAGMLLLAPTCPDPGGAARRPPKYDLALRMAAATTVVVCLTGFAVVLGPHLAGLLSPLQVYAGTLAVVTHRHHGSPAAARVMSGAITGGFAFAACFTVLAGLLPTVGTAAAFAIALGATAAVQVLTLPLLPREPSAGSRPRATPEPDDTRIS